MHVVCLNEIKRWAAFWPQKPEHSGCALKRTVSVCSKVSLIPFIVIDHMRSWYGWLFLYANQTWKTGRTPCLKPVSNKVISYALGSQMLGWASSETSFSFTTSEGLGESQGQLATSRLQFQVRDIKSSCRGSSWVVGLSGQEDGRKCHRSRGIKSDSHGEDG